ncbi:S-layer homology domain-containing protein [Paenibacillus chibensis]|uniref:S-layer homology domain-containing protein n=1 Tax=Paenibacillus chibensis TaxID=59846 RepID=A0ABU6PRG7_9BACL|nr:S-layer homology domain-containing protein [Paenibacillus chibensis]
MRFNAKMAAAWIVICSFAVSSSASAFSDIKDPHQNKIVDALQSQGIIHGVSAERFAPSDNITAAQAVSMLVKAMDLKAVNGAAEAPGIPPNAWFAQAANIAAGHGLLSEGIKDWNGGLTKEQFAVMLHKAITETIGTNPSIQIVIPIADMNLLHSWSGEAVHYLLLSGITELDGEKRFHPQSIISRMEAAEMTFNALKYMDTVKGPQDAGESDDEVSVQVVKVNDQVNEIILSKSDMPNPGYGILVDRIEFSGQRAVISYHFTTPEPGQMYPQVISTAKTSVYVDSKYKVSVKRSPGEAGLPFKAPGTDPKTLK